MKKINVNPILKKEIRLGARTVRLPVAVLIYAGFLSFIAVMILNILVAEYESGLNYGYYSAVNYSLLNSSYTTLVYVQLAMICLIVPILTASSIAGERERQTLDIMLTSPVRPFSIVWGKLGASMAQVLLFVVSSLPAMSLMFIYGGIQWYTLLYFLAGIAAMSFFIGAIGIWCSSLFKKSISSVIVSLVIEIAFYLVPFLILIIRFFSIFIGNTSISRFAPGFWPLFLLLDPVVGFVDLMNEASYGEGVIEGLLSTFSGSMVTSRLIEAISPYWGWISMGISVLLGFFFLWLASRQIDSVRIRGKRRNRKEMTGQKAEPLYTRGNNDSENYRKRI